MKSIIKYITIYFVSSFVLLSSASAITLLAWPGGPAEGALKKVVDNYNKKTNNNVELLYFSRDNFFDKMLSDVASVSKEFYVMLTAT